MSEPRIYRQIVQVGRRQVHLRHAGSGPRLLLIHGSPASSEYFIPLVGQLSGSYCCISPDTPGFGESAALPAAGISIAALAMATAELIETLQCAPCLVLGSHSGAAIALELATLRPDLVSGLVIDGLPMFTADELDGYYQSFFEQLQVDERGGHFARTWTRIRDMFIWFPWTSHDPARLNGMDLPPAPTAHKWVSMLYQSAPNYVSIYRAAVSYGERAAVAAATQTIPTLYMAHDRDMLAPHLSRLPKLKACDRVELTSSAPGFWLDAVRRGLRELALDSASTLGELNPPVHAHAEDRFVVLPEGQLRLRRYGAIDSPPLLMLHDAPASGRSLHSLAVALSSDACVWLPDLPGCGASEPLAHNTPVLQDYAETLGALMATLGAGPIAVYGRGCGASLALILACMQPERVSRVLLDELPLAGPDVGLPDERICAPITIEPDGSHWFRTWQMLRDSQIFWPWYLTTADHLLRLPGNYDGEFMHDWVRQVMEQPETAHLLPHAVCNLDAGTLLAQLTQPTTLLSRIGHPLGRAAAAAVTRSPQLLTLQLHDDGRADELRRLLNQ